MKHEAKLTSIIRRLRACPELWDDGPQADTVQDKLDRAVHLLNVVRKKGHRIQRDEEARKFWDAVFTR